jgi:hypothetical protein
MKKFLLSLFFIGSLITTNAQKNIVFNEIYPDPNVTKGRDEFIELFNTTPNPISLGCYVLVTYFDNGTQKGLFVYNFPTNAVIPGLSQYVLASDNAITYKGGVYTPTVPSSYTNWNSGSAGSYLTKYIYDGTSFNAGTMVTSDDLMYITNGNDAAVNILLYKIDPATGIASLENGFFGNGNGGLPTAVTSLPNLTIPADGACSINPATLSFAGITYNNVEVVNVGAAAGQDNEYRRTKDGVCGAWVKESVEKYMTPGSPNSTDPPISVSTEITVGGFGVCGSGLDANGNAITKSGYTLYANMSITVTNTALLPGVYRVFIDNGDGVRNNLDVEIRTDVIQSPAPSTVNISPFETIANRRVFVQVTTNSGCIVYLVDRTTDCIVTPVTFKAFKADRKSSSSVGVTWTTASEQNNKGFFVQRNDGSGWKNVAFVFSASNNGNSSSDLSYSFNDVNTETAISQYRVQQVDLDGMARYSTIAAVRGLGTSAKLLVYPNPSANGNVNVVFDDNNSVRDVQVSDAAGRTIKQFKSITNNLLLIENLKSGFYTIKVTNRNTAATTVEKVVVK